MMSKLQKIQARNRRNRVIITTLILFWVVIFVVGVVRHYTNDKGVVFSIDLVGLDMEIMNPIRGGKIIPLDQFSVSKQTEGLLWVNIPFVDFKQRVKQGQLVLLESADSYVVGRRSEEVVYTAIITRQQPRSLEYGVIESNSQITLYYGKSLTRVAAVALCFTNLIVTCLLGCLAYMFLEGNGE